MSNATRRRAVKTLRAAVRAGGHGAQSRVAAQIGAHPVTVCRWVKGDRVPSAYAASHILAVLGEKAGGAAEKARVSP